MQHARMSRVKGVSDRRRWSRGQATHLLAHFTIDDNGNRSLDKIPLLSSLKWSKKDWIPEAWG